MTAGIYMDRFFPGQDDGWFGGVEVDFYFDCIGGCQGGSQPAVPVRRDVEPYEWYETDILIAAMTCQESSPPSFRVKITEIDGDLNGSNEDWGTLNFPPRNYGTVEESWIGGNFMIALRMICK